MNLNEYEKIYNEKLWKSIKDEAKTFKLDRTDQIIDDIENIK